MTIPIKKAHISRERKTIRHMIGIHCRGRHHPHRALCPECEELLDYAMHCIDRCPYREDKPACAKCPIHCHKPDMREKIREVMRYAGPHMMIRHPLLTVLHYVGGRAGMRRSGKTPK